MILAILNQKGGGKTTSANSSADWTIIDCPLSLLKAAPAIALVRLRLDRLPHGLAVFGGLD